MQIHELNAFLGALNAGTFLAVDDGDDTGRLSIEALLRTVNERIDHIITSPAPTEQEIIDARRGWNEVVYGSLGTAIRSQVKQILAQFYKFNTYDLLAVYGTPISRTRNGVTFTWDDAGQVCEVSGEAVGGDAYASIYTQTGAWPGIFEHGVVYTVGYETTDQNVKLRIAVWEGVETTPDYYYFDEDGHFGIPPEAAKISIDLWVASGDTVSAVVKNVCMLRTYTAKEVTATIRDAMIGADRHMYNSLGDAIREQLNGKVDKEEDMGLSQKSFTDAEQAKLEGVATGAQVNVIETVKVDGTPLTPDGNKAVDIPVDDTLTEAGTPAEAKAVGDKLEKKANSDGYYETLTSGQTEQIIATEAITDTEPYIYRKTGGPNDVGDRVYDTIVGGSVVWNQLVKDGNFTSASNWKGGGTYGACSATFENNVATITINDNTQANARPNLQPQTITAPVLNHKYLFAVDCNPSKSFGSNNLAVLYGGVFFLGSAEANTWNRFRKIVNAENTAQNSGTLYTQSYVTYFDNGDTIKYRNYNIIDLTALLNPEVADYIYALEQANAGAGVACFRKYFPLEYYGYCEPHFEHVQTSAKCTVGFNQWDEEWEVGSYNATTGAVWNTTDRIRSKSANYIDVLPNTVYCIYAEEWGSGGGKYFGVLFYDGEKTFLSYVDVNNGLTFTTPSNARYVRFSAQPLYGTTYKNDICLNISGDRDGEYEAYRKRTYPIEPKVLRGYPTLDASNNLRFDGDTYTHDGTITRKRHLVDLGTLNYVRVQVNGVYMFRTYSQGKRGIIPGYVSGTLTALGDKEFVSSTSYWDSTLRLAIRNDAYTTAADFKTAMSGVYIEADLAEPTTETAEPFQSPMVVDPLGTEEFIDYGVEQGDRDVAIPVGHKSEYPPDLRGKLQHLPGLSSSGDGRYVVVQTGTQMSLTPDTSLGLIAALEARVAALEGGN